jgi:hypothetical protein
MNLAEFLLARVADDQRDALADRMTAEAGHGVLELLPSQHYYVMQERQIEAAIRVLAECEAKRRLIELHADHMTIYGSDDEFCEQCSHWSREGLDDYYEPWPCEHLRILASVYRDHPDFDPAWSVT